MIGFHHRHSDEVAAIPPAGWPRSGSGTLNQLNPDLGTAESATADLGSTGSVAPAGRVSHLRRSRNQSGFTLVEILLTVAIAGIVLAPVGGWMVLAITSQGETAGRFSDAAQTRLLETYIARDVASAEMILDQSLAASTGTSLVDCSPSASPAGDPSLILNLRYFGTEPELVVYKTATVDSGPALVRRACSLGIPHVEHKNQTIVHGLADAGSVTATCSGAYCKQVVVDAELASGATLHTSATRRGTAAALEGLIPGSLRPQAVIDVGVIEPRTPSSPYRVNLSGASSWDLDTDSSGLTYQWTAVGGSPSSSTGVAPVFEWSTPGPKQINLRVTDDSGNVSRVSKTVVLENQQPIIDGVSITLADGRLIGIAGSTEFTFEAEAYDPDGSSADLGYEWQLPGAEFSTNPVTGYVFPVDASGTQTVDLTITDADGGRVVRTVQVLLAPGGESDTLFFPLPDVSKTPPLVNLDTGHAITFTPSNPPLFQSWELRDSAGVPVASSTDPSWTYVVPISGGGTHTIVQFTTTGEVLDEFRINHPPSTLFSYSTPNPAPTSIAFTDLSTDPPYAGNAGITSRLWDFGSLGTSTDETVDILFPDSGDYEVTLTVTDVDGAIGSFTETITIPAGPATTTTTIPGGP